MDNLLLGCSSLKMGTTEDTRRRQNTGLSRVISNRVKGMGNNKEADMEFRPGLVVECRLYRPRTGSNS
jgi:hypothetical protein